MLLLFLLGLLGLPSIPVWAHGTRSRHGVLKRPTRAHRFHPAAHREGRAPRFGTWGQGAWSWFGDPRAVYVSGQYREIFVGWLGWSGGVTVGAYDPRFGVLEEHVVGYMFHDDHSAPSIFVEPDKRLTVFWSAHNGSAMYYRSTLRPEDISAWGPLQHVPRNVAGDFGFTYPNPILLPSENNKLYLFWRGGNWSEDFATRRLDGLWSPAHELISVPGQRPYVKVDSNGRDQIALAFTDGHPRNVLSSIYYASYRSGSLWSASGRQIARIADGPIAPWQADLIYNAQATGVPAWVWDVAIDTHGRPVIVYATFPSYQRHDYWYADWTGSHWLSHFMTAGGGTISPGGIEYEYSGGITLDHNDPATVYLSRQVADGFEIERWTTPDHGTHWHASVVVPAAGSENVRPVVPRGWDRGPMHLLWLHGDYGSYSQYRTWVDYLR
ncbi:MAG: BNR-4 repeat-containing protein [Solirubrobacterales bacterium]|nr:BNR-4 repeat-containing protein [Solirubrobacterales bacterium]